MGVRRRPARARFWQLAGDQCGGAAIEFAILAPVLFTILLGSIDMGRMFYVRQSLGYAAQQAARYYALNPASATSAVTTFLRGQMMGGMGAGISVAYADTANCNANSAVTCTTISATYSFSFIVGYLSLGTKTLLAKAEAVRLQ